MQFTYAPREIQNSDLAFFFFFFFFFFFLLLINPRRACAARVTVVVLCVCVCVCVCVSVCSISATTSKSKPRKTIPTLHCDKKKRIKLAIFLKMLRSKVMASFAHSVGVRRSCRALQFILTATEAAIATQKPVSALTSTRGKPRSVSTVGLCLHLRKFPHSTRD